MKSDGSEDYYSPEEAKSNIEALIRGKEYIRLQVAAKRLAQTGKYEPDDLIQEAFVRVLGGTRNWKKDVPAIAFLIMTMKSIASQWGKLARRLAEEPHDDNSAETTCRHAERIVEEKSELRYVLQHLGDDDEVRELAIARALGKDKTYCMELFGNNSSKYESVRRRLLRRLGAIKEGNRDVKNSERKAGSSL